MPFSMSSGNALKTPKMLFYISNTKTLTIFRLVFKFRIYCSSNVNLKNIILLSLSFGSALSQLSFFSHISVISLSLIYSLPNSLVSFHLGSMAKAKELLLHLSLNLNSTLPSLFLSTNSLSRSSMARASSSMNCIFFRRSLNLSFYFGPSLELNLWQGKV